MRQLSDLLTIRPRPINNLKLMLKASEYFKKLQMIVGVHSYKVLLISVGIKIRLDWRGGGGDLCQCDIITVLHLTGQ